MSGYVSVNPDIKVMFVVSVVFLALSWIAMLLRIYVRTFMVKSWGWDDTLMVLSMLTFTVECGLTFVITTRPETLTFKQLEAVAIEILISSSMYLATSILFKLSLAIFFLRFLQDLWQRRVVIAGTILYSVFGITFIVLLNTQCGNPRTFFLNQISRHCGAWHIFRPLNYTYAATNALTDWIFALIPITMVRAMNIPLRARVSACFLLGLGVISSIVSLVRMKYIEGLDLNVQLFPSPAIGTTSCLELGLGLTAASCATLRPLFRCCVDRTQQSLQRTNRAAPAQSEPTDMESKKDATQETFAKHGVSKGLMGDCVEVEEAEETLIVRRGLDDGLDLV
ncbi:hypothetical protein CAC42_1307 [Sphaceloma murrayae]|uniref:Rhodopsin domain-containing protein n=1 Tax=Sphaceloma murrayae TaxID=2082308 RepID=A0A2K1QFH0_9PEZI|nr:hypothetical protein CAC42_1307 [Sphaceloma murrayae]